MRPPGSYSRLTFALITLACVGAAAQTTTFSPVSVGGVVNNQLVAPTIAPVVQAVCSGATSNYQYEYAAVDAANGITSPSPANAPAVSGCTTLSTSNFNIVSTSAVSGSSTCTVWRTAPSGVKGKVGSVPCGGAILDNATTLDGSSPPGVNNTGSVNAGGTVTAQNFLASSSTSAGTSDWVEGSALPACSTTQPQPCIQPKSFFIEAYSSLPATPFGWVSPTGANPAVGPLIVGTPSGIASQLSYGSLTDSSSTTPAEVR